MATRPNKKALTAAAPATDLVLPPPSIDWTGPVQERKVVRTKSEPGIFTLDDGTRLEISPVIVGVRRAVGQYNQHGQPLYFVTIANYITTLAPKALLKSSGMEIKKKKKRK